MWLGCCEIGIFMGGCTSTPRVHIGVRRMGDPVRARAGFRPCYMWGARSATVVLRGPQVGKFPAGLMPLIGPSLRRSPATFQTLGHGDLSNARSLLIAMSPLQSIVVMHPWVAAAWCRLYRTDASSASVQRVRADFAAAFVTVRAEERAAGTGLRRREVMGVFGIVLPAMQT